MVYRPLVSCKLTLLSLDVPVCSITAKPLLYHPTDTFQFLNLRFSLPVRLSSIFAQFSYFPIQPMNSDPPYSRAFPSLPIRPLMGNKFQPIPSTRLACLPITVTSTIIRCSLWDIVCSIAVTSTRFRCSRSRTIRADIFSANTVHALRILCGQSNLLRHDP